MTILKLLLSALGLFKILAQWFRDLSIHDAGRKAERLAIIEAERKADEAIKNVKPVTRDDLVKRLRDGGEF